jgi:hypothetical protein
LTARTLHMNAPRSLCPSAVTRSDKAHRARSGSVRSSARPFADRASSFGNSAGGPGGAAPCDRDVDHAMTIPFVVR